MSVKQCAAFDGQAKQNPPWRCPRCRDLTTSRGDCANSSLKSVFAIGKLTSTALQRLPGQERQTSQAGLRAPCNFTMRC